MWGKPSGRVVPRWLPVLPPWMGVLSQAVAVAVWCTPGVPVCRVPDVVRASVGWGLVGESVECVGCLAQSAGRDPGFWWRRTRRGVKWRRVEPDLIATLMLNCLTDCCMCVPVRRVSDAVRASGCDGVLCVPVRSDGVLCVPVRRVPDVVRASGGEGLVGESSGVG